MSAERRFAGARLESGEPVTAAYSGDPAGSESAGGFFARGASASGREGETIEFATDIWQVEFARDAYQNAQTLMRFLDQKVNFTLVASGLLTTGGLAFAAKVVDVAIDINLTKLSAAMMAGTAAFWLMFALGFALFGVFSIRALLAAAQVLTARSLTVPPLPSNKGLLFPLLIESFHLRREPGADPTVGDTSASPWTAERYDAALSAMSRREILAEYAHQIASVSVIYRQKTDVLGRLQANFRTSLFAGAFWLLAGLLLMLWSVVARAFPGYGGG